MIKQTEKPASIKDVARQAQVSISTVSNVLNGTKSVSSELTKRVTDAVRTLGYEANMAGRQLKSGKSNQVAFVIHSFTSVFFPNILKSIQRAAVKEGYTISVFNTGGSMKRERSLIQFLRAQGYDGVLLSSCADVENPETQEYVEFLHSVNFAENPMHIICLESAISTSLDAVVANDVDGIIHATDYLFSKGKTRIAHIAGPHQYMTSKGRRRGYESSLLFHGQRIDEQLIAEGDFTCKSGYYAMQELFARKVKIDALVAANDQMAIGAINCIKKSGLRIPEDIAVVGFNDNSSASLITPSLTTIRVPKSEMGTWAFELFMRRTNKDESARMLIQLDGELITRNSTDPELETEWDMDW